MAGAVGVVITTDVLANGQHAQPVYVDDSLPIVGPSRAIVVTTGEVPQLGGPPMAVRLAPAGTPAIGPALAVYVVPGGGSLTATSQTYTQKVIALSPIGYWPLAEASGTTVTDESGNGRNGVYKAVGEPLLAQTGIGDGRTAPLFDGTNDFANLFSASLQAAFNNQEGTLALWMKVSAAGVWTDATIRRFVNMQADASNRVIFSRTATNNQISWTYVAGGVSSNTSKNTTGPVDWVHLALTWSKSADQAKAYYNGVQEGATMTGLGVWAGSLASANVVLGAISTAGTNPWSGYLAHAAVWTTPLSAAQIATLATV